LGFNDSNYRFEDFFSPDGDFDLDSSLSRAWVLCGSCDRERSESPRWAASRDASFAPSWDAPFAASEEEEAESVFSRALPAELSSPAEESLSLAVPSVPAEPFRP